MDEDNLLVLLEENPEQGILLLKEKYMDSLLFAAAQRLSSPDDVQECVYDTLTDFYLKRNLFDRSKGSLRSYLTAIADRKAIRKYRENQRQWLLTELSQQFPQEIENWEKAEALRHALSQLSEKDRKILEKKYFYGYSTREIAKTMGMEYEAVKKRLQRGLKKLLLLIEE